MWERNNINIRFLWGSLPRPMSSHMCSACVCVCVYSKGSTPMGTAASSVSPTSFSLIPTSKSSNAVDSVCHCHALKASSAYEAWSCCRVWLEWRSPQQNRDYCWPGGHCSAVLLYDFFFLNKTAGWGQCLLQSLDIWEENYQQRALLVVSTDWTFKIREVN